MLLHTGVIRSTLNLQHGIVPVITTIVPHAIETEKGLLNTVI